MMDVRAVSTRNLEACAGLQADVLIAMPCTDIRLAERAAGHMARRAGAPGHLVLVQDLDGWGFIRIVNQVFKASQGRYFGYVAQDAFAGRQWLKLALEALAQPGKALLAFNDGKWHGAFASFGLTSRDVASRNYPGGELFHPAYHRHFADVEISLLARSQGQFVYDPRSVLVEVDWSKDSAAVHANDRQLYQTRLAQGFEGRVNDPALLSLIA